MIVNLDAKIDRAIADVATLQARAERETPAQLVETRRVVSGLRESVYGMLRKDARHYTNNQIDRIALLLIGCNNTVATIDYRSL